MLALLSVLVFSAGLAQARLLTSEPAISAQQQTPLGSLFPEIRPNTQGEAAGGARHLLQGGSGVVARYYCGTTARADPYDTTTWQPFTPTTLPVGSSGALMGAPISLSEARQFVYQSSCAGPSIRVRIPVPAAGNYLVTVLAAEPYWTSEGRRVFDAAVEGLLLLDNIDIVKASGGPYTAYNASFVVNTADTLLTLIFTAIRDQALISGIIVSAAPDVPAPPITGYGINVYCDTLNFTDANGKRWTPVRGSPYVVTSPGYGPLSGSPIQNAGVLGRVYRTECVGVPSIVFPVPRNNSIYAVTFYFSENYWTAPGRRVFSVLLERAVVLPNYDIFADVGINAAASKTFYVNITDGDILVNFVSNVDQAHFSGISVELFTSDPATPIPAPPVALPSPPPPSPLAPLPPASSPPPVEPSNAVFRMYCGSGILIDTWGGAWADNTAFQLAAGAGFGMVGAAIDGAPSPLMRVYQSECASPLLKLGIAVPAPGPYDVTILNSENWFTEAGARVFSVAAEGAVVLPDVDLFAAAGGKFKAVNHTFRLMVTDGFLNLTFAATKDQARFSGIFVNSSDPNAPVPPPALPSPLPSPSPSPPLPSVTSPAIASWCGTTPFVDQAGVLWRSRAFFTGAGYTGGYAGGIVNATDDRVSIYGAECVGPDFGAVFTGLEPGDYTVSILAAETYFTAAAARVFSISIQGTQVLNAVDLYKDFGPLTAATFTFVVPSVTTSITFRFASSADQARIGGIIVTPGVQPGVPVITPAPTPAPLPPQPIGGLNPPVQVPKDPTAPALNLNFNGPAFVDAQGNQWIPATNFVDQCAGGATGAAIVGAPPSLNTMLQTECFGPFKITIPVQNTGTYMVRLWNSEIFADAPNFRQFDVLIGKVRVISAWDIFTEAGGKFTATYKEVTFTVTSAEIEIELKILGGFDQPSLKGLQLVYLSSSTFTVQPTPSSYSFQLVDPVNPINNKRNITFQALLPTLITGVRVQKLQPSVFPDAPVFSFRVLDMAPGVPNTVDTAATPRISYDPPFALPRQAFLVVEGTFLPRDTSFYACRLELLAGVTVVGAVNFDGTGDLDANVPHVLHVVADGPRFLVDVDGTGALPVTFDATPSHTHDPAHRIVAYQWTDVTPGNTAPDLGTAKNVTRTLAPGTYAWNLTIFDDKATPDSKPDTIRFNIYPPAAVPGTFAKFYLGTTAANLTSNLAAVVPSAAARMPGFWLVAPLPARVAEKPKVVAMVGTYTFPAGGSVLDVVAGVDNHTIPYAIYINGAPLAAGAAAPAGVCNLELRLFVSGSVDLPVALLADGKLLGQSATSYNEAAQGPVINSVSPTEGIVLGGTRVTVQGFGWKMSDLEVLMGDVPIPTSELTQLTANSFYFFTPAVSGPSATTISVTSKAKTSNAFTYSYLAADQPVPNFRQTPFTWSGEFNGVTSGQWCHGRYFFSGTSGYLYEVTFNDDHTVMTNVNRYDALVVNQEVIGRLVLGLACNPLEPAERFKIWLTHSDMFDPAQDPTTDIFQGISEYSAMVGYFQWPEMDTYHIVIDQLPCATVFHSVASLGFDNKGLLYVGIGANTNTGAPAPRFGNLAESPWSAGVIRADVMNPNFKGRVQYEFRDEPGVPTATLAGKDPHDQQYGLWVKTVPSSTRGMEMYAYGLRNPLGLTFHTNGKLYTCDNGPNADSGPALLAPGVYSQEYVGTLHDKIDLIEENSYHGIGNENRAMRGDVRQGTYIARDATDRYYRPSFSEVVNGVPVNYTQPIGLVLSSSNGMDEYRANTFLGAMRGWLLISKLATFMYFVKLTPDGTGVEDVKQDTELNLPQIPSLKTITGPGGVIVGIDFDSNSLRVMTPVDTARDVAGLTYIYDVFPWRAPKNIPANQTFPFVISGANFGNLDAPITVKFGDVLAQGAQITGPSTIKGNIPSSPAAPDALIDIVITTASGTAYKLSKAFRYLDDYTVQLDDGPKW